MNSFDSYVSQFAYPQENQETEKLRQQFLSRFPVSKLPTLTLQEYALGLEPKENSFCYWIEFKTRTLGGTGGGSSYKHVVFFQKEEEQMGIRPEVSKRECRIRERTERTCDACPTCSGG